MLKKVNRASTKEVENIFKGGRFFNSQNLTFKYLVSDNSKTKISVIVPKSVAKLAVKRNLLRRKGYAALAKQKDRFPVGVVGVLVFKKFPEISVDIADEIKNIFSKIN